MQQEVYPYGRSNQRKCIKSKVSCLNNECSFWLARKQIENDFFDKKNYNKNLLDIANDIASMCAWMSNTPMHKTIYVPKQNYKKKKKNSNLKYHWQKNNNNIFTFVKDNEKLHLT